MVGGIAAESRHLTLGFPSFGLAATASSPEPEQSLEPESAPALGAGGGAEGGNSRVLHGLLLQGLIVLDGRQVHVFPFTTSTLCLPCSPGE